MYTINYNTGAGNQTVEDLDEAKAKANEGATYTQQPITIEDERGKEVTRREWYGTLDGVDGCEDPIWFGSSGFYADWQA